MTVTCSAVSGSASLSGSEYSALSLSSLRHPAPGPRLQPVTQGRRHDSGFGSEVPDRSEVWTSVCAAGAQLLLLYIETGAISKRGYRAVTALNSPSVQLVGGPAASGSLGAIVKNTCFWAPAENCEVRTYSCLPGPLPLSQALGGPGATDLILETWPSSPYSGSSALSWSGAHTLELRPQAFSTGNMFLMSFQLAKQKRYISGFARTGCVWNTRKLQRN